MIDRRFYKRSFDGPYLRCMEHDQGCSILADLHEENCRFHFGLRSLIHRAILAGFYWPTMKKDAIHIVRYCDK